MRERYPIGTNCHQSLPVSDNAVDDSGAFIETLDVIVMHRHFGAPKMTAIAVVAPTDHKVGPRCSVGLDVTNSW